MKIHSERINQRGLTLTELMITIAILAILIAIAIPQMQSWRESMRLNGAARIVNEDLQRARISAIKEVRTITLSTTSTTAYSATRDEGTTVFSRDLTNDYYGITISINGGGSVAFGATGMAQNRTVTLQGSAGTKTISVVWTGRTKIK